MSDSYEALIDVTATLTDAKRLASLVVDCLLSHGLIEPALSEDCVLGSLGYPALLGAKIGRPLVPTYGHL